MAAAAAVRERNTGFLGSSAFSSLPRADAVLRVRAAFVRSPNAARLRVPSTPDAAELLPAMPVPVPLEKEFGRPDASDAPVMETGALPLVVDARYAWAFSSVFVLPGFVLAEVALRVRPGTRRTGWCVCVVSTCTTNACQCVRHMGARGSMTEFGSLNSPVYVARVGCASAIGIAPPVQIAIAMTITSMAVVIATATALDPTCTYIRTHT